jgi:hypothetical protein
MGAEEDGVDDEVGEDLSNDLLFDENEEDYLLEEEEGQDAESQEQFSSMEESWQPLSSVASTPPRPRTSAAAPSSPSTSVSQWSFKIRVGVRRRPLNARARARGDTYITSVHAASKCLTVHDAELKVDLTQFVESHTFRFDEAFSEKEGNREIYVKLVRPLVEFVMEARGGRATCFAYGQTVRQSFTQGMLLGTSYLQ